MGLLQALWLKHFAYGKPRSCLCFWQLPCPLARAMQSLLLAPCPAVPRAQLLFIDWVGLQELGNCTRKAGFATKLVLAAGLFAAFPPPRPVAVAFLHTHVLWCLPLGRAEALRELQGGKRGV